MPYDVVCLRPEADFLRVGVKPPASLSITYLEPDDADLPASLKRARALVIPAVGPKLAPELFLHSELKLVQITGAGVDRLDKASIKELGIAVANVPGASNNALAEYAVACALVLLRRFAWADGEVRRGNYAAFRARMVADGLPGLEGLTVGVIGLGNIGLSVAQAFQRMGSEIVYYDPAPGNPERARELGARPLALPQLLEAADVVTLHVPLMPSTQGLISTKELARMKTDAILINAARGGIVDEAALAASLASGDLGAAAVDVYSNEPPSSSSPLFELEGEAAQRVLFTPHIAGVTRQASAHLFRSAWENVVRVLDSGEAPLNRVY